MLGDCVTNQHRKGLARAKIIADAAHCTGRRRSGRVVGKPEVIQKRACGKFEDGLEGTDTSVRGERHCVSAVAFMVAGGGFEPPTFGLCDLTHLSVRVGLYLHPRGVLAIQSLRLPPVSGAWFGIALSLARRRFYRL